MDLKVLFGVCVFAFTNESNIKMCVCLRGRKLLPLLCFSVSKTFIGHNQGSVHNHIIEQTRKKKKNLFLETSKGCCSIIWTPTWRMKHLSPQFLDLIVTDLLCTAQVQWPESCSCSTLGAQVSPGPCTQSTTLLGMSLYF